MIKLKITLLFINLAMLLIVLNSNNMLLIYNRAPFTALKSVIEAPI